MLDAESVKVRVLGSAEVESPLKLSRVFGDGLVNFLPEGSTVPLEVERIPGRPSRGDVAFEKAGPRERIRFDPKHAKAALVTCGGLCPGLNNVIRSIVLELHYHYGVREILGARHGYAGFDPEAGHEPLALTPDVVEDIHKEGGTILSSSRGPVPPERIVRTLRQWGVNLLFTIGGDGTQTGAHAIAEQARREEYELAVVGVPKTIDNDIRYVWRTFGYYTAIEKAVEVINCAHVESKGVRNGIAVVKLMGRDAGYIAAGATVASGDVNFCLVPEVPFDLQGPQGFPELLRRRILARKHAVVVVAEGAGQDLLASGEGRRDASGNLLHEDIGPFLVGRIKEHFGREGLATSVKYIDPSYIIRSIPADCEDALLCDSFARNAVHAAMAGRTDMVIGYWYNVFIHVPIPLAVEGKKHMHPESELWRGVLATTGQPARMKD